MGVLSFCCRSFSVIVVLIAIAIGYISTTKVPMGTFFWMVHQPHTLLEYVNGKLTPEVPADLQPISRPNGEITFKLPSGAEMPGSGIGMCCRGTAYHSASVYNTVLWYLLQGGRHIDTADVYVNHADIGRAIKEAVRRGVPRSEMFVTTKIFPGNFGKSSAKKYVPRVLDELQLEYIDLVLLHAPVDIRSFVFKSEPFASYSECKSSLECWSQTWDVLSKAVKAGKIKDLGVSNFNHEQIQLLQTAASVKEVPIAVNQLPFNPWVPQWQKDVVKWCQDNGIRVTGYFTFGGLPGKSSANSKQSLKAIAAAHNVSTYLVLARWSLQRGVIIIPGTGNPGNMLSNLNVHSFQLSDAEMKVLDDCSPDDPEAPNFLGFAPPEDGVAFKSLKK